MPRVTLRSPHDPITVANRLKAAVGDTLDADTPKRVTGNGTDQSMTLWVHRPRIRNSFRTRLAATLEPDGTGTRIAGDLGAPRFVTLFTGCWFVFVAIFTVPSMGLALFGGLPLRHTLAFALIPIAMIVFGTLLIVAGRWHGKRDAADILAFLEKTIDAHPIDAVAG